MMASATGAQFANAQAKNWQGIAQIALSPSTAQLSLTNSGNDPFRRHGFGCCHNSSGAPPTANVTVFNKGIYQTAEAKMVNQSSASSFSTSPACLWARLPLRSTIAEPSASTVWRAPRRTTSRRFSLPRLR